MKSVTVLFITCIKVKQIVQNKTRTELVANQREGLPLQLRVEKDCHNDNSHNVIY